jgi:hypothetical protein
LSKLIKSENEIICEYLKIQYINGSFEEEPEEDLEHP